jgi:hypothetical protein
MRPLDGSDDWNTLKQQSRLKHKKYDLQYQAFSENNTAASISMRVHSGSQKQEARIDTG